MAPMSSIYSEQNPQNSVTVMNTELDGILRHLEAILHIDPFDPEGDDYDYITAAQFAIRPDETGHWPSRIPETGQILKGRKHKTFHLTEEGEEAAGYQIYKGDDNKYYSGPK